MLPPQWPSAGPFSEGLGAVQIDGKVGYINTTGKVVIPPNWAVSSMGGGNDISFHDGRAEIHRNGRVGLMDRSGKIIVASEWDRIERQSPYYNNGYFAYRFADHSLKMPGNAEVNSRLNGLVTPEMEAQEKFWRSYRPAETAWYDRDGKMVWHSWQ